MEKILEFFVLGVSLSFGPCFFFCSPAPLTYIAATKTRPLQGFLSAVVFSLTRTISHSVLGLIAGIFGSAFMQGVYQWRGFVYQISGILIALIGLLIIFVKQNNNPFCSLIHRKIFNEGIGGIALLGFIAGLLPCLSLLGILLLIVLYSQHWWQGFLYGLSFGAGGFVSPLLILGFVIPFFPNMFARYQKMFFFFTGICGLILFAIGIKMFFDGISY